MGGCADCDLPYGDWAWCDVVIPTADWLEISPTGDEGGILCFTCIARRLVGAGLENVPMIVTSGPFERDPRDGRFRESPSWNDWWPAEPKGPA